MLQSDFEDYTDLLKTILRGTENVFNIEIL